MRMPGIAFGMRSAACFVAPPIGPEARQIRDRAGTDWAPSPTVNRATFVYLGMAHFARRREPRQAQERLPARCTRSALSRSAAYDELGQTGSVTSAHAPPGSLGFEGARWLQPTSSRWARWPKVRVGSGQAILGKARSVGRSWDRLRQFEILEIRQAPSEVGSFGAGPFPR